VSLSSNSLPSTLVELLRERARQTPDRELYVFLYNGEEVGERLCAGEFDLRARAIAAWLQSREAAGRTVLLAYPPGLEFATAFFGCLYAGAIGVPGYIPGSRRDTNRLAAIAYDAQARLALTSTKCDFDEKFPQIEWGRTEALPSGLAADWKEPSIGSNNLAYLQYTSGSTDSPRGVMITHGNVLANLRYIDEDFGHTQDSVSVTWLPHFHDMGLVYGLLQPLYGNFRCVMMSPGAFIQRPARWLRAISVYKATHSGGPNFAYDLCLRRVGEADRREIDLSSWQVAFNGAEPVRAETLEQFAETFGGCGFRRDAFYPAYGLAEATLKVATPNSRQQPVIRAFSSTLLRSNRAVETDPSNESAVRLVGCGLPSFGTSVVIADVEADRECAAGEIGEILVSGPAVAAGYWLRAEESELTFRRRLKDRPGDQFLRTGDLGVVHRDQLFVTGRLKELIIIRGQNFYPQDLETTVEHSHPALRPGFGAAFTIEVQGREGLAISYELTRGYRAAVEDVVSAIRRAVAAEHGLTVYAVILLKPGGIPKTTSGKIQRFLCRDAFLSGTLKAITVSLLDLGSAAAILEGGWLTKPDLLEADPSDRSELVGLYLVSRLAESLGIESGSIDATRPAVAYGVDSITAAAIKNSIETDLGVNLSAEELLEETSLFGLATKIVGLLDSSAPTQPKPANARHSHEPVALPCSFEQERLWLLDQMAPGYTAHNVMVGLRLSGEFQEGLFVKCLRGMSRRHNALRMRFGAIAGAPIQIGDVADRLPISIVDLMAIDGDDRAAIATIARCEAARPFRLNTGPLARATIIRLSAESRVLLLTVHHIMVDGYSVGIILREALERYRAAIAGREPELSILSFQYADFVQWSRDHNNGEVDPSWSYWRAKLASLPPDLKLPYDRARLASTPLARSQEVALIKGALYEKVRALSMRTGTTLFMTLAAAFTALLHRSGGQEDIVFGCPTSGRFRPEFNEIVGQFAYPIVFRIKVARGLPCESLLSRIRENALEAYRHSKVPFAKVVELASPARRDGFNPLFRVMMGLMRSPFCGIAAPDLSIAFEDLSAANADCDIFLTFLQETDGLRGLWTYDESLFDAATIRMLIDSFHLILEQMTENLKLCLSDLRLSEELDGRLKTDGAQVRTIAIASTFTANPIEDVFRFWADETGRSLEVYFAPYNQVFQELLDPGSGFSRNQRGVNVLLIRFEDWTRFKRNAHESGTVDAASELERNVNDLIAALQAASVRSRAPILVCLCSDMSDDSRRSSFAKATAMIVKGAQTIPGVHVMTSDEIDRLYPVLQKYDPYGDAVGHIPLTRAYSAAIATAVVRKMISLESPPLKVIAVDCDQTLWDGVCGEVGPGGVECDEQHLFLHRFLLAKQKQGMLLCLCSKNNQDDVTAVFEQHPEMPLRLTDIIACRINWKPKSENLRSLAAELNVGLDAFVFIDDDPVECAEVSANCPQALTVQFPSDPSQAASLFNHLWLLDAGGRTDEDGMRAVFHKQNIERQRLASASATLDDYLAGLDLEIRISTPPPDRMMRVAQLTQRTSQFNLNGKRWGEAEVASSCMSGSLECLAVDLQDRFGSYGMVGAILFKQEADALKVENLVLSCRALGRRVEHSMLLRLGEIADDRGLPVIELETVRTARNLPAIEFLSAVAHQFAAPTRLGRLYRVPVREAKAVAKTPPPYITLGEAPLPAETSASASNADWAWRQKFVQIARDFNRVETILEAMAKNRTARTSSSPYIAPRSMTEHLVAKIWSDVLEIEPIGANDNFFELGGHSLSASQVVARIQEFFKIDFPLKLFFTGAPTIAELSKQVEKFEIEAFGGDAAAGLLAELDSPTERAINGGDKHEDPIL
jgi:FkbH-like protein